MKTLKLLHLNVERDNHLEKIYALIGQTQPDVICLQEAFDSTIDHLKVDFPYYVSAPRFYIDNGVERYSDGAVVMSRIPISDSRLVRYGYTDMVPVFENEDVFYCEKKRRPIESFDFLYALACIEIVINNKPITIATTHFPAIDRASLGRFDNVFEEHYGFNYLLGMRNIYGSFIDTMKGISGPVIFTADFNNPRGEYLYDNLAHELVDHVPSEVSSTIDPQLHKVAGLSLVVDTVMATPDVTLENVELVQGVSDHKAIVAEFSF